MIDSITCPPDVLRPPAAIVRPAQSRNPAVQRPVLQLARKPVQRRVTRLRTTVCALPAVPGQTPKLLAVVLPAGVMPALDPLPEVAVVKQDLTTEPFAFDPPSAGRVPQPAALTWTLASAPLPAWLPALAPWAMPEQLPVVPEPPTWALLLLGAAGLLLWGRR